MNLRFRGVLSFGCLFLIFTSVQARPPAPQNPGGGTSAVQPAPNSPKGGNGSNPATSPPGTPPGGAAPSAPAETSVQGAAGSEGKKDTQGTPSVPTPTLTAITPAAPLIAPNQPLTITGADFQEKLTVTLIDPQGNSYELPGDAVLQVKSQRLVVVATLGVSGRWQVKATNPGGKASEPLGFPVANSPGITLLSPSVLAFCLAALIITAVLAGLFIVMLLDVNRVVKNRQWSLADALSEESAYQPKEIMKKEDVILLASTSRLIALLGLLGILTTVLGIGYSIMWNLFIFGTVPDLTMVRSFLFGSACLFAPYLANQIGGMFGQSAASKTAEAAPAVAVTGVLAAAGELACDNAPQNISVTGVGFQAGLTVTLTDPLSAVRNVPAGDLQSIKPTLVAARLVLNTPGSWRLTITNPGAEPAKAFLFDVFGSPTLAQTDPSPLPHNVAAEFDFVGTGFMSGLTVQLTGPPPPPTPGAAPAAPAPPAPPPFAAEVVSVTYARVRVKAALANQGTWHAVVTNPGNHVSAGFDFQVT